MKKSKNLNTRYIARDGRHQAEANKKASLGRKVGCTLKLAVMKEDQEKESGLSFLRFQYSLCCVEY